MTEPSRVARICVVVALLFASVYSPAGAQPTAAGALTLKSQTTWWLPEQPFIVEVGVQTSAPESLEIAVSLYRKAPNRTEFAGTIKDGAIGRPVEVFAPVALTELAMDDEGDRIISVTPTVRATGVFPLRVELRPIADPGTSANGPPPKSVASFLTYLVHVPAEPEGDKLGVSLVVPAHARPAVKPDGTVAIDDERAEQLAELATSLEAHPDLPFTLAPTPETAEALANSPRDQDRTTVATLAASLGKGQLLGGPYVPTNLTAVVQSGLNEESAGQLTRGTETLRAIFGQEPTTSTRLIDERLTEEALTLLQSDQLVRRLVIPESLLEPVERRTTLANAFELENRKGRVPAAVADRALSGHFNGRDEVLAAQRLLADLAVIYNDDPAAGKRGVVVSAPRSWTPSGVFVEALLAGLASSPILDSITLDRFFDTIATATTGTGSRAVPLLRKIGPPLPGTPNAAALPGATIGEVRRRIDAFASAVEPLNPILGRLDRTLLVAQSADLRSRERLNYLEGIQDQIGGEISKIAMPQNRSITLTARDGEIPITITSTVGYPVRAVLRVVSDTLEFPDGATQDLDLVRRNTTSQFSVRAQTSGSFPLRVRLESPEGLVLAESRFTVRSTAVSGVGTALSIGAGLFLLVWWGNHLRGRRSRRLIPVADG